jgi:hypothetical protein
MAIERLNAGAIGEAAQVPFYDPSQGQDRRASVTDLVALVRELTSSGAQPITQYAAPNATGFSVTIAPPTPGASMWLLLTPAAGYAAGTVVLPPQAACVDGQELQVSSTQAVTALTINGSGSTVNGGPTALTANSFFRLRFDGVFKAWYRVG